MVNQKVAARLQVGPNCLLFFIDETGHETFADKNYPVFGLGGCAINLLCRSNDRGLKKGAT